MGYQTSKRRGLGCAALALILSIAAVVLTPIGPIYIYGWLVPIIDPIIPKPEDVPSRAEAEYHWKGFGLVWYWEDEVSGGCARWWAADSFDKPVRGLTVFEESKSCSDGERVMDRASFDDHTTFGVGKNNWPYESCPFSLSEATVSRYLAHIAELKRTHLAATQRGMLEKMQSEIEQIEPLGLRAQQYGCRVRQG